MTDERAALIIERLQDQYPQAECELHYDNPFELLVAVILSAQCTDKRVNAITPELFAYASKPEQFAVMEQAELEKRIFSCGFYRNKAKNIIAAAKAIVSEHNGQVPADFNELVKLPGVGRKTANVMVAEAFGGQAIAVDTHVFRTANRLGLAKGKTPYEVEMGLRAVLDEQDYTKMHHVLIFHGRYTCKSQNPDCASCAVSAFCEYKK